MDFPKGKYKTKTAYDGLSALNKVGLESEYIILSSKNVDIISSELWPTSPFLLVTEHVYGHQYTLKRPLTMLEKLSYKIDIKSKPIAQKQIEEGNPYPVLSTKVGIGSITCCGELVISLLIYLDEYNSWLY